MTCTGIDGFRAMRLHPRMVSLSLMLLVALPSDAPVGFSLEPRTQEAVELRQESVSFVVPAAGAAVGFGMGVAALALGAIDYRQYGDFAGKAGAVALIIGGTSLAFLVSRFWLWYLETGERHDWVPTTTHVPGEPATVQM